MKQIEILKTYIAQILTERNQSMAGVARQITSASDGLLRSLGTKRHAVRLAPITPKAKVTDDQLAEIIRLAGFDIIKIISSPSRFSSKFPAYVVSDQETGEQFNVVMGIGRNKGQEYEDEINAEVGTFLDTGSLSPRIKKLFKALGIRPSSVKTVVQASNKRVKRPITSTARNDGAVISDMTLIMKNGDKVYISLKDKSGGTFANGGYSGGFIYRRGRWIARPHPLDDFIEALGVDKKLAAKGYSNYAAGNKTPTPPRVGSKQDFKKVAQYLGGAYGYGYWYVREQGDSFQIKDIRTEEGIKKLVGDVIGIQLRYPGASKQITATIETTENTYVVEVRNSHGAMDPNEVKVKIK